MRRRKKNTLLPKMPGIAVLVNAILLPLLAQLGVFKGMHGSRLEDVRLVTLPPEKKPPTPKHASPKKTDGQGEATPGESHPVAKRCLASVAPQPESAQGRGLCRRFTVRWVDHRQQRHGPRRDPADAQSARRSGPRADARRATGNATTAGRAAVTPLASTPTPAPTPPHVPVVVQAELLSESKPQIPDDLSYDDIHGDFQALFAVKPDGTAAVQMVSSTGNPRLDSLALDAARHWTFRPGTVDGKPVDSYRRLTIQFYAT